MYKAVAALHDIEQLFQRALPLPEEERQGFLQQLRVEEESIAQVLRMIALYEEAQDYFISLRTRTNDLIFESQLVGTLPDRFIGSYRIDRELGRGGMGRVLLVEQPVGDAVRPVALKLLPAVRTSPTSISRFEQEEKVLGRLNHPNIAQLYEAGYSEKEEPYFVMEYVAGMPIDQYCEEEKVSLKGRLRLFLDVLAAVQHAHQSLVIHRDIKPSNVMVRNDGMVKLLDFGIAKILHDGEQEPVGEQTRTLAQWMTPHFAAPEQVKTEPVTTATDVYQCGVLLFKLLTGQLPYDFSGSNSSYEKAKIICEQPARLPSSVIPAVFSATRLTAQGDIDAIVSKAIRKEPAARYQSIETFAEDIRRYLAGLPVAARQGSTAYHIKKYLARNRVWLSVSVTALLLLIVTGSLFRIQIVQEQRRTEREASKAAGVSEFMLELFRMNNQMDAAKPTISMVELIELGDKWIEDMPHQPELQVRLLIAIGDAYWSLGDQASARAAFEEAIKIGRAHPNEAESQTGIALTYLGAHSLETGGLEAAEKQFQECIDIFQNKAIVKQYELAGCLEGIGRVWIAQERFDEAEAVLRRAVAIKTEIFGEEHAEVAWAQQHMAVMLREKGDLSAAEALLNHILTVRKKLFDQDHPEIYRAVFELARLARYKKEYALAEERLLRVRDVQIKAWGAEHFNVKATERELTRLYDAWGKPQEAVGLH